MEGVWWGERGRVIKISAVDASITRAICSVFLPCVTFGMRLS